MHISSSGNTKFRIIWILDYLWKRVWKCVFLWCFFFFSSHVVLYMIQKDIFVIPSDWRYHKGIFNGSHSNFYHKSMVCFMGLTVRLQSAPNSHPAALQNGFITITINISAFAHWEKRYCWFDRAKANHGWLDRSEKPRPIRIVNSVTFFNHTVLLAHSGLELFLCNVLGLKLMCIIPHVIFLSLSSH